MKIAVSAVSAENALKNLDADIPHWDFDKVRSETRKKWDRELSKIQIEGTQEEKETFYTAMYHAFTTPNLYQDVTGEYRGLDQNIHKAEGFTNYAIFSLWDTFRAAHPLFALIQAERDADMINSMLAHYDQSVDHLLPIWSLQGNETWCMVGYHAVPVIVDAYFKGVKGFDAERAYQGDQDHGHESRLRQPGRLRQIGLGALRSGKRIGLENARIRLRRLVHRADGQSPREKRPITSISCAGRAATKTSSIPRPGCMRGKDSTASGASRSIRTATPTSPKARVGNTPGTFRKTCRA